MTRANILISYAFLRKDKRYMELAMKLAEVSYLLIDSGAYTNFQELQKEDEGEGKGYEPITIDEYIEVCQKKFHGKVWQYIALDVIANTKATRANLRSMWEAGLKPMAVFVLGDEWEWAEELVKRNRRMCVGCVGNKAGDNPALSMRRHIEIKRRNPSAEIHGLGFTRFPDCYRVPLSTYDSSSFMSGGRYGTLMTYSASKGKIRNRKMKDLLKSPRQLKTYKDPDFIVSNPTWAVQYLSTNCFIDVHEHSAKLARGFFFAVPNPGWFARILAVWQSREGKEVNLHKCHEIAHKYFALWREDYKRCIDVMCQGLEQVTGGQRVAHMEQGL